MRSDVVFLALVLSVLSIHPIAGFAESNAAYVEIKDIHWEMGPPMPWPTKGQAQVVIGETIVAAGSPGYPGWVPSSKYSTGKRWQLRERGQHKHGWELDTRSMKYSLLPDMPVGIKWPQGVAIGQDLYLFTGWIVWPEAQRVNTSNRMFRLSKQSGEWKWGEMPPLRIGRFLPGGAASGTTIVVLGGQATFGASTFSGDHPGAYVNSVEAFDTAAPEKGWRDLPPIPGLARESPTTTAIGKNIYIFGGDHVNYAESRDGKLDGLIRHCADGYVLNLETLRWKRLPDLPFPVHGMEAVPYKDRYIIMAGGIKNYRVDHPYEHANRIPKMPSPNFDVVVFDTKEESYRILPTQIPPYPIHPERREQVLNSKGFDLSKGVYRLAAELSRVGNRLFLCGGEVISPHNVTDEVVVGTIIENQ